jgi:hypothetical protein
MPAPLDVFPEYSTGSCVRFIGRPDGGTPAWVTDGGLAIERSALAAVSKSVGAYATRQGKPRPVIPWKMFENCVSAVGTADIAATFTGVVPPPEGDAVTAVVATASDGRQVLLKPAKAAILAALLAKRPSLYMTISTGEGVPVLPGTLRVWTDDWRCVALLMPVLLHARKGKK